MEADAYADVRATPFQQGAQLDAYRMVRGQTESD
jgi:hypothetical protein